MWVWVWVRKRKRLRFGGHLKLNICVRGAGYCVLCVCVFACV